MYSDGDRSDGYERTQPLPSLSRGSAATLRDQPVGHCQHLSANPATSRRRYVADSGRKRATMSLCSAARTSLLSRLGCARLFDMSSAHESSCIAVVEPIAGLDVCCRPHALLYSLLSIVRAGAAVVVLCVQSLRYGGGRCRGTTRRSSRSISPDPGERRDWHDWHDWYDWYRRCERGR